MRTIVFLVTVEGEIVFVSFSKDGADAYADSYNADYAISNTQIDVTSLTAIVSALEIPIAMLQRIPRLSKRFEQYPCCGINSIYQIDKDVKLLLGTEWISVKYMRAVRYNNDEYIFIESEDMWYLAEGTELVLPDYDTEQKVEAYADVTWSNHIMDKNVVLIVDAHEYTRLDVFNACNDFLELADCEALREDETLATV